ncbi:uncharacterized protein [Gorilla gorilla gorilla]|uniref:uncharacterized protein n=1 Tax=Gorilla gorilla gorilla TaxID=9595 RepID=UPI002445AA6F|nr:uncharacterized protein LOC129525983 [Gorilla gorilla gorilla]
MAWLSTHAESRRRDRSRAGEEGGRGRGRPHRRAGEPPPDPTQPPAVGETPAWAHVTSAGQPAAAPETSNAASAAQHPRRVSWRAVRGWPRWPQLPRAPAPPLRAVPPLPPWYPRLPGTASRSRAPLRRKTSVPPTGRGCSVIPCEARSKVGPAGVRRTVQVWTEVPARGLQVYIKSEFMENNFIAKLHRK